MALRVLLLRLAFASVALSRAAEPLPGTLLLDGAVIGAEVIVVGERGAISRSNDSAQNWQPVRSTVSAMLTGVSFAPGETARQGWAAGHEAVIVFTADGGRTWTQQYQGENLQDSFLDILALDTQRVIAVGAYGLYQATMDGGKTWTRRKLSADDYHFNRISRGPSGTLYLAGEHGTLLRSRDDGANWTPIPAPYDGSFYGILPLDRQRLLAHGLRGHLYRSVDDGAKWEAVATPHPTLIATALRLKSNYIVLGGQARGLMVSRDFGRTVAAFPELTTAVSELLELANGMVLVVGEGGAGILEVSPK
ncbi:MAG TPA: YCF48-related protein [Opitutaceae bacterium]|nr:YCF48-related protein [Opitutaceae bacterium]